MVKVIEKVKNFFSGKVVYKPKCCSSVKTEPSSKPKEEAKSQQQTEGKLEEQK